VPFFLANHIRNTMIAALNMVQREYIRDLRGNSEFKDERTDMKQNIKSGI